MGRRGRPDTSHARTTQAQKKADKDARNHKNQDHRQPHSPGRTMAPSACSVSMVACALSTTHGHARHA